ncbi:hypothetical protein [Mycobacterium sp. OTB74]|uniref:hypothetical protein n=1 Tax=Mycobacterium sp. OTB74 TaxID=1853452 RepID=UPI0024736B5A|nr:hypothetical protein [Mycobacterium sp. OTB74]MDH6246031.1 hypothetical protein [Mycobacterium sp. OTB74]
MMRSFGVCLIPSRAAALHPLDVRGELAALDPAWRHSKAIDSLIPPGAISDNYCGQ